MRKLNALCLLLISLFVFSSCEKEDESYTTETVDAVLKWSGNYAVDGCGFFLVVGEQQYKFVNETTIPETYKESGWDGTAVEVKMINYNKKIMAGCQVPVEVNSAKILEIRKK
ncbi:hypothetical protein [Pontibacter sp. H249]|uniref:hypothetical protein n=1 Tax=Pontibacter sp. H249 TaxID=3133420 RepID=UPI0030C371F2